MADEATALVEQVNRALAGLDGLPVDEHAAVFTAVHADLSTALDSSAQSSRASGAAAGSDGSAPTPRR